MPKRAARARQKDQRRRKVAPQLDDFVARMLAGLASYSEVTEAAMDEYGCDERTATRAIARVRASWKAAAAESVDDRRAKFIAELEEVHRSALAAGDYRAVAVLSRVRADVEGLRSPKKVEHSGVLGVRPVAAMSPAEREHEIKMLEAKRQAALGAPKPVTEPSDEQEHAPTTKKRAARVH